MPFVKNSAELSEVSEEVMLIFSLVDSESDLKELKTIQTEIDSVLKHKLGYEFNDAQVFDPLNNAIKLGEYTTSNNIKDDFNAILNLREICSEIKKIIDRKILDAYEKSEYKLNCKFIIGEARKYLDNAGEKLNCVLPGLSVRNEKVQVINMIKQDKEELLNILKIDKTLLELFHVDLLKEALKKNLPGIDFIYEVKALLKQIDPIIAEFNTINNASSSFARISYDMRSDSLEFQETNLTGALYSSLNLTPNSNFFGAGKRKNQENNKGDNKQKVELLSTFTVIKSQIQDELKALDNKINDGNTSEKECEEILAKVSSLLGSLQTIQADKNNTFEL